MAFGKQAMSQKLKALSSLFILGLMAKSIQMNHCISNLLFVFAFFLGAMSVSLAGCKKENDNPFIKGTITWNANNKSFTADADALADRSSKGPNGEPMTSVAGFTSDDNSFQFYLLPVGGTGRYIAGGNNFTMHAARLELNGKVYTADNTIRTDSLTITVTEFTNAKIKGTFDGVVKSYSGETLSINGAFDMDF
jgi:hypothetical protein